MKKIFIDSSVVIEYQKENTKAILLLENESKTKNIFYINPIVVSEVAYILKKKLKFEVEEIVVILKGLKILPIGTEIVQIAYRYMHQYNMKPNDAIISATCKFYKIQNLMSMDNDFENVCTNEGINLIN